MKNSVNLYWYKIPNGEANFGDELNHFVVSRLCKRPIRHIQFPQRGWRLLKAVLGNYRYGYISLKEAVKAIFLRWRPKVIIGIGSVVSVSNRKDKIVWGSGIISLNDDISEGDFRAVRGPYTAQRMQDCGLMPPDVYGDPALLLPMIFAVRKTSAYKIGLIPHHVHYDDVFELYRDVSGVAVIDLLRPVEEVLLKIGECSYILSSSLHGLIVPHTYGIPSVWVEFGGRPLFGDDIKFRDYMASVGLKEYNKIVVDNENFEHWFNTKKSDWISIEKPEESALKVLRENLMRVKPF